MKMESLHELYVEELKDLHSAEKQLVKALPKMAKAATNPQLRQAFENHLEETMEHVSRIENLLGELDELGRGKKCHGMEGLIEEGKELIAEKPEPEVLDAGLISKAQHVEHYEIAGYGTVRAYARLLGREGDYEILSRTLEEEKNADVLLTKLALDGGINIEANDGQEGEDGDEAEDSQGSSRGGSRGGARGGSKSSGSRSSSGGSRGGSKGGSKGGSRSGGSSRGGSRAGAGAGMSGGGGAYRSTAGRSR